MQNIHFTITLQTVPLDAIIKHGPVSFLIFLCSFPSLISSPCNNNPFHGLDLHNCLSYYLPYDDKHNQRVAHQAHHKDHRVDCCDDDRNSWGDIGLILLQVLISTITAVAIFFPTCKPAVAGPAWKRAKAWGAGGTQLFTKYVHW